ncbi:hypothetical protein BBBOND_0310060 [Babesia bigemina]|uniref:Uncharacterized protein n=1 Tax=Babesia bigemina TaxID=5866 RepID=A0A061D981_BABBI|nr:hypothetical protein BBBOND_0310060 [Babesia bigemina]CDR97103.1 hypothetical protein BBBOND_0310060 [Babesia bigemina]|eukprot:XP_012769289.1 hypothetical protein BBBOND_0310060 [Babesia bigemina]
MWDLYIQDSDPSGGWESDSASENVNYIPLSPQYVNLRECSDCASSDYGHCCDYGVDVIDCCTCDQSAFDIPVVAARGSCNACHHATYDDRPKVLQFEGEAAFTTEKPAAAGLGAGTPSLQERRSVDKPKFTKKAVTIERGDQTVKIEVPSPPPSRPSIGSNNMPTRTPAPRRSVSAASKRNRAYMFCGRPLAGTQNTSYRNIVLPRAPGEKDVEIIAKRATNDRASSHEARIKPPQRGPKIRLAIEAPRRGHW